MCAGLDEAVTQLVLFYFPISQFQSHKVLFLLTYMSLAFFSQGLFLKLDCSFQILFALCFFRTTLQAPFFLFQTHTAAHHCFFQTKRALISLLKLCHPVLKTCREGPENTHTTICCQTPDLVQRTRS